MLITNSVPDPWHLRRILGSTHWITDPDPALFVSGQQKMNFMLRTFCLLLTLGTFTTVLKENMPLRSHKTVEIRVSLNFLACRWKDPDPGGPKTYGSYAVGSGTNTEKKTIDFLGKNGGLLTWGKQRWDRTGPSSTCSPPGPRWCNPSRDIAAVSGQTSPRHLNNSHGLTLICRASVKQWSYWLGEYSKWPCSQVKRFLVILITATI